MRLRHSDGQPAKGAYIKNIKNVWSLDWIRRTRNTHECYQLNDTKSGAPLVAPNFYTTENPNSKTAGQHDLRVKYRAALEPGNSSNKRGCRKYVQGALYQNIDNDEQLNCLRYDQRESGDAVFIIRTRQFQGGPESISHLKVTSLAGSDDNLLSLLHERACMFIDRNELQRASNARCKTCDRGSMTTVGTCAKTGDRETVFSDKLLKIAPDTGRVLPKKSCGVRRFCERKLPRVLGAIRHMETNCGGKIPDVLGGESRGVSTSMLLSCDLMNASHYDIHDASVSFTIWTETKPGSIRDWYFVLPNVLIKYRETTFSGLCFRLFHGCSIAWDGRIIRHGTSVHTHTKQDGHTIGWFWGANARSLNATVNEKRELGDDHDEKQATTDSNQVESNLAVTECPNRKQAAKDSEQANAVTHVVAMDEDLPKDSKREAEPPKDLEQATATTHATAANHPPATAANHPLKDSEQATEQATAEPPKDSEQATATTKDSEQATEQATAEPPKDSEQATATTPAIAANYPPKDEEQAMEQATAAATHGVDSKQQTEPPKDSEQATDWMQDGEDSNSEKQTEPPKDSEQATDRMQDGEDSNSEKQAEPPKDLERVIAAEDLNMADRKQATTQAVAVDEDQPKDPKLQADPPKDSEQAIATTHATATNHPPKDSKQATEQATATATREVDSKQQAEPPKDSEQAIAVEDLNMDSEQAIAAEDLNMTDQKQAAPPSEDSEQATATTPAIAANHPPKDEEQAMEQATAAATHGVDSKQQTEPPKDSEQATDWMQDGEDSNSEKQTEPPKDSEQATDRMQDGEDSNSEKQAEPPKDLERVIAAEDLNMADRKQATTQAVAVDEDQPKDPKLQADPPKDSEQAIATTHASATNHPPKDSEQATEQATATATREVDSKQQAEPPKDSEQAIAVEDMNMDSEQAIAAEDLNMTDQKQAAPPSKDSEPPKDLE